jgi:hypothetical protein
VGTVLYAVAIGPLAHAFIPLFTVPPLAGLPGSKPAAGEPAAGEPASAQRAVVDAEPVQPAEVAR